MDRFLRDFFDDEEFLSLQIFLKMFELLIKYHDPELYSFLRLNDLTPELFATPWLLTIFCSKMEISLVLSLWDHFLLENERSNLLFIALALILNQKQTLISTEISVLPQILTTLVIRSPNDLSYILAFSNKLRCLTPLSFCSFLANTTRNTHQGYQKLLLSLEDLKFLPMDPIDLMHAFYQKEVKCNEKKCYYCGSEGAKLKEYMVGKYPGFYQDYAPYHRTSELNYLILDFRPTTTSGFLKRSHLIKPHNTIQDLQDLKGHYNLVLLGSDEKILEPMNLIQKVTMLKGFEEIHDLHLERGLEILGHEELGCEFCKKKRKQKGFLEMFEELFSKKKPLGKNEEEFVDFESENSVELQPMNEERNVFQPKLEKRNQFNDKLIIKSSSQENGKNHSKDDSYNAKNDSRTNNEIINKIKNTKDSNPNILKDVVNCNKENQDLKDSKIKNNGRMSNEIASKIKNPNDIPMNCHANKEIAYNNNILKDVSNSNNENQDSKDSNAKNNARISNEITSKVKNQNVIPMDCHAKEKDTSNPNILKDVLNSYSNEALTNSMKQAEISKTSKIVSNEVSNSKDDSWQNSKKHASKSKHRDNDNVQNNELKDFSKTPKNIQSVFSNNDSSKPNNDIANSSSKTKNSDSNDNSTSQRIDNSKERVSKPLKPIENLLKTTVFNSNLEGPRVSFFKTLTKSGPSPINNPVSNQVVLDLTEPKGFPLLQTNKENYFSQFSSKQNPNNINPSKPKNTVFSNKRAIKYSQNGLFRSLIIGSIEQKESLIDSLDNTRFSYFLCRKIKEKAKGNYSFRNSLLFINKNVIFCMNFEKNLLKLAEKARVRRESGRRGNKFDMNAMLGAKEWKIKAFFPIKTLGKISSKKVNSSILSFYFKSPAYEKIQEEFKEYSEFLEKGEFYKANKENRDFIGRFFKDWHLKAEEKNQRKILWDFITEENAKKCIGEVQRIYMGKS